MDLSSLNTFGSLAAFGGLGAAAFASWNKIKSLFGYIRSFVIMEVKLDLSDVRSDYLSRFLMHEFKMVHSKDKYIAIRTWTTPDPKIPYLEIEYPYLPALFYRGKTFLVLTDRSTFLYLRGTVDLNSLLIEARTFCLKGDAATEEETIPDMYKEVGMEYPVEDVCGVDAKLFSGSSLTSSEGQPSGRVKRHSPEDDEPVTADKGPTREYIYRRPDEFGGLFWTPKELDRANRESMDDYCPPVLSRYFYSDDALQIMERAWNWYHSREWYISREIPWQRGILAYGPAGSGKSTFFAVLAELLCIPIYRFNLSTFSDQEFINKYQDIINKGHCCMILFEDFDNIYNLRQPEKGVNLTFDCLLNQISGVGTGKWGRILAITTNDLSKVDPAIGQLTSSGVSSRPGRIDDILYIGEACDRSRKEMCHRVLRDWPDLEEKAFNETSGMVISQVRAHCINLALKRLSEKK